MNVDSLVLVTLLLRHVFSLDLDVCTNITTACPPAEEWLEREKQLNCENGKRYVCLMATGGELREGCKFNTMIPSGKIGCPGIDQCDPKTDQPVLVSKYLRCPPDTEGCPPKNHSGYYIIDIHKYRLCQGRSSSDTSPTDEVYTPPTQSITNTTTIYQGTSYHQSVGAVAALSLMGIAIFGALVLAVMRCRRQKHFFLFLPSRM